MVGLDAGRRPFWSARDYRLVSMMVCKWQTRSLIEIGVLLLLMTVLLVLQMQVGI